MANYKIKCEAIEVRNESGICPGSAKCRKGETYILTARTLEREACAVGIRWRTSDGICHALVRENGVGKGRSR